MKNIELVEKSKILPIFHKQEELKPYGQIIKEHIPINLQCLKILEDSNKFGAEFQKKWHQNSE